MIRWHASGRVFENKGERTSKTGGFVEVGHVIDDTPFCHSLASLWSLKQVVWASHRYFDAPVWMPVLFQDIAVPHTGSDSVAYAVSLSWSSNNQDRDGLQGHPAARFYVAMQESTVQDFSLFT